MSDLLTPIVYLISTFSVSTFLLIPTVRSDGEEGEIILDPQVLDGPETVLEHEAAWWLMPGQDILRPALHGILPLEEVRRKVLDDHDPLLGEGGQQGFIPALHESGDFLDRGEQCRVKLLGHGGSINKRF
jgi:hypothetical protein